jgi:hypothetical protein
VDLSWESEPADLDLHAWLLRGTVSTHISYRNPGNLAAEPFAVLNGDRRSAPGSETIRVARLDSDVVVAVHEFQEENRMRSARPVVQIQTSEFSAEFRPPTTGDGTWWLVGRYRAATKAIEPIQRFHNAPWEGKIREEL